MMDFEGGEIPIFSTKAKHVCFQNLWQAQRENSFYLESVEKAGRRMWERSSFEQLDLAEDGVLNRCVVCQGQGSSLFFRLETNVRSSRLKRC